MLMGFQDQFSFAADTYNRYPGEVVRFFLRAGGRFPAGCAQVVLPPSLHVETFGVRRQTSEQRVSAAEYQQETWLVWEWGSEGLEPGSELEVQARVEAGTPNGPVISQARLLDANGETVYETSLQIMARRSAEPLKFLPEIYRQDDFTSRFLMLFESFWKPISGQIDSMPCYFDPHLTPAEFVPWLASWFGLVFDEDLSEAHQRDLLSRIFPVFASKGTPQALVTFLSMYTGGSVEISEHRDTNFVLEPSTSLGYQIALGTNNHPHTFDVRIRVPAPTEDGPAVREQLRKRIESLIATYKPAHTRFHLDLTFA